MKYSIPYKIIVSHLLTNISLNHKILQSTLLFVSMALSLGSTFLASVVTARMLGPEKYGDLKFIQSIWSLINVLLTFGYLQSGSRLLATIDEKKYSEELVGTVIIIAFLMGIGMMSVVIILSYPIDYFFNTKLKHTLFYLSPLIIVLPLRQALSLVLQSLNKIYYLSLLNVLPTSIYLLIIFIFSKISDLSTGLVLFLQQSTLFIVVFPLFFLLKPSVRSFTSWFTKLKDENKHYGNEVYKGSLASVATSYINRLAIAYWVDNKAVGFYSLALSLVEPLKMIPISVASSSIREFAKSKSISRKIILSTSVISLLAFIGALVFFGDPLSLIYSKDFSVTGQMANFTSVGAILYGFGDFFNRFLGVHGRGKSLKKTAYLVGLINCLGIFILVPLFGAWGAVITSVVVGISYLFFMSISYIKYTHFRSLV